MTFDEARFVAFFQEAHADRHQLGPEPFAWQRDLARHVAEQGWPTTVDVPTGLGKTSLIDIAVYMAATEGVGDAGPGRRRTFFVIDRRVVVDEAHHHARQLARNLRQAEPTSVLGEVALHLRSLVGASEDDPDRYGEPLVVARMRGGVTWSWRWLDRPDRAAVVVGTVDQLGSRFLFQGYGVGPRLRPIDAALVGTDSLIVVDEAHLAQPLVETVRWAARGANQARGAAWARPEILTMSATPGDVTPKASFTFDLDAHREGEAAKRLWAPKRLHTVVVPPKDDLVEAMVRLGVDAATADEGRGPVAVGIICNSVARARAVVESVRRQVDTQAIDVALLTGRVRPVDGQRIRDRLWPSIGASRDRASNKRTILVATQTVEVGANIDLDALVTESAPVDALVQRLGRLNRMGRLSGQSDWLDPASGQLSAHCVVVHHDMEDPVYGEPRTSTWAWLSDLCPPRDMPRRSRPDFSAGIDVCPASLRSLVSDAPDGLVARSPEAPALFPALVADWAATSLGSTPLAEVEPFLHGLRESPGEVSLVWRADLPPGVDRDDESEQQAWQAAVDGLPPAVGEQLALPIHHAVRWMRGVPSLGSLTDVPTAGDVDDEGTAQDDGARPRVDLCLIWRGPGEGELLPLAVATRRIRPNDIVVLPAHLGGCDGEGWAPKATSPVEDLAELAPRSTATSVLRIDPRTLPTLLGVPADDTPSGAGALLDEVGARLAEAEREGELDDALLTLVYDDLRRLTSNRALTPEGSIELLAAGPIEGHRPWYTTALIRVTPKAGRTDLGSMALGYGADGTDSEDPSTSSALGDNVPLRAHLDAVGRRARSIARALGLSGELQEAVTQAALFHDLGKWDPRFQVVLHAGDRHFAQASLARAEPLGKSGMDPGDRRALRYAWRRSGLPRGYRHEVGSAQAAAALLGEDPTVDAELVQHLVASHHGHARPLLPPVRDDGPAYVARLEGEDLEIDPGCSVDYHHPARFERLSRRYGHWGLALLEAVVRLSDIGCSEEGT